MKYKAHLEQLELGELKSVRERLWHKKIKENFDVHDMAVGKYSDLNILAIYNPMRGVLYFNLNRYHFEVDEALSRYDASTLPTNCITIFVQNKDKGLNNEYVYEIFEDFSAEVELI